MLDLASEHKHIGFLVTTSIAISISELDYPQRPAFASLWGVGKLAYGDCVERGINDLKYRALYALVQPRKK